MNEKCKGCGHRRKISAKSPYEPICNYFFDTGKLKNCTAEECTHYTTEKVYDNSEWRKIIDYDCEVNKNEIHKKS